MQHNTDSVRRAEPDGLKSLDWSALGQLVRRRTVEVVERQFTAMAARETELDAVDGTPALLVESRRAP